MSKPDDIPQDVLAEAERFASSWFSATYEPRQFAQLAEAVGRAILAAKAEERARWAPAQVYFERYCQDEADDVENCVCGMQQHNDAMAFAAILKRGEP